MKCPICENNFKYNETHHIQSKSKNGNNKQYNKTKICPSCHELIHRGDIIIEGRFLTTNGYKLIWRYKSNNSITNNKPNVFIR